ncbi:hypothetical protein J6590_079756 [Homalodisca vitripennis]|nr:hypothetical protein J6590_079756 [Homalodisca vitripennis]
MTVYRPNLLSHYLLIVKIHECLCVGTSICKNAAFELDTTLLVNQLLRVTLLRLGEDYSLYVQPAPEDAELLSLEAEAGHGIKCCLSAVRDDATDEERAQLGQLQAATALIIHVDAVLPDGSDISLLSCAWCGRHSQRAARLGKDKILVI